MEGMIGGFDNVQRSQAPQPSANWPQQVKVSQFVAGPLQEEHRYFDSRQMITTACPWLSRWMQRKAEKHQAADTRKVFFGGRHGSHSPSHRLSSCQQW